MKGIVFTEFLDFVAERFSEDMVDEVIDAAKLPSGGAYTSVGTYDHAEIMALFGALADRTGQPAGELVRSFGHRLTDSFAHGYPAFFERTGNLFDFLESIESHIHVEVRKLYPDAELPNFTVEERTPTRLVIVYRSPRRMSDLAEGLILGSARQFGVEVRIHRLAVDGLDDQSTRFAVELV